MSVEHITYNGEKLPVKLGYYSLMMLQKEHGVAMEQLEGDLSLYQPLLFYALKQGHKATGKEFTFKMEDMGDILDDCFFEFVGVIPKFFPEDVVKMAEVGGQKTKKKAK